MTPSLALSTPRARAAEQRPRWQGRRAQLLHNACNHVAAQLAAGVKIGRACRSAAAKFRGRQLGGGHRLALSEKTMRRLWYSGKRSEEDFRLQYVAGRRSAKIDPVLLQSLIARCLQECKTVSEEKSARKLFERSFGHGDRKPRPQGKIPALAKAQQDELWQWMNEPGLPYRKIRERAKEKFGIEISQTALSEYYTQRSRGLINSSGPGGKATILRIVLHIEIPPELLEAAKAEKR